jgi:hypothetical protein
VLRITKGKTHGTMTVGQLNCGQSTRLPGRWGATAEVQASWSAAGDDHAWGLPAKGRRFPCPLAAWAPHPAVFAHPLAHFSPSCPALIHVTVRGLRPLQ